MAGVAFARRAASSTTGTTTALGVVHVRRSMSSSSVSRIAAAMYAAPVRPPYTPASARASRLRDPTTSAPTVSAKRSACSGTAGRAQNRCANASIDI